jgi:hypothetical protein
LLDLVFTYLIVSCVWVDQSTQRSPIDHEPGYKRSKLRWREDVDLKHTHGLWTDGLVPDAVDAQFRELVPNTPPEVMGELALGFVLLEEA